MISFFSLQILFLSLIFSSFRYIHCYIIIESCSFVPYFWIAFLFHFQEPECIYQRKLPDLPNQFNFENCKTRMLLVVFVWRTKYGRFSRSPPETLSTKSYWCLMHAVKSTRVSTLCFFRLIHIIICFLSEKLHICFII